MLILPAGLWYLVLLVAPIVIVMPVQLRPARGDRRIRRRLHARQLRRGPEAADPIITSLTLALSGTILCILVGLPLAYYIATRAGTRKSLFIILLVIPFWTSFLIRTYAWLMILGPDGAAGFIGDLTGNPSFRILGTEQAVLMGLVYGYLPLMVFPLYVTLERMDRTLVEASKDLGAGRWATFRQITLPVDDAGPHHGQHPRLHPDDGRVRHPADPRLRPGLHDGQRAGPALPRVAQLAGRARPRPSALILVMLVASRSTSGTEPWPA